MVKNTVIIGCDAMQLVRNCPFWRNLLFSRYPSVI